MKFSSLYHLKKYPVADHCKHEVKNCPSCHAAFECKAGSITQCQCYAVVLSPGERNYVEDKFTDCLCASCLLSLKSEYRSFIDLVKPA